MPFLLLQKIINTKLFTYRLKQTRGETFFAPSTAQYFIVPTHYEQYARLSQLLFGEFEETWIIDYAIIELIGWNWMSTSY